MKKQPKFKTASCKTCKHPEGRHDPVCWAYGLVEPRCRQHCQKFVRKNERSNKKS